MVKGEWLIIQGQLINWRKSFHQLLHLLNLVFSVLQAGGKRREWEKCNIKIPGPNSAFHLISSVTLSKAPRPSHKFLHLLDEVRCCHSNNPSFLLLLSFLELLCNCVRWFTLTLFEISDSFARISGYLYFFLSKI